MIISTMVSQIIAENKRFEKMVTDFFFIKFCPGTKPVSSVLTILDIWQIILEHEGALGKRRTPDLLTGPEFYSFEAIFVLMSNPSSQMVVHEAFLETAMKL